MALRDFLFGFKFLATDYVSPVLKNIEGRLEALNTQVKNTARRREAGTNLIQVGAGITAVGGATGFVFKDMLSTAAEAEAHWNHLATNLADGAAGAAQMAEAQKTIADLAVKYNYSQNDITDNLYRAISFTGDFQKGMAVTAASLAVAKGNLGDAATIGQQLSIMLNNWPGAVGHTAEQVTRLADQLAFTSRHGAFNSSNDVAAGLSVAIGSIKAAGLSQEDALSLIQAYSRVGMVGTEAGSAIIETLQAMSHGKLQKELGVALAVTKTGALDVVGTLVNLRDELGRGVITAAQFQRASAALGIRGERALAVDVDALVAFRKQLSDPNIINGAAVQGAMTIMAGFSEQMGVIGKKWEILSEHLGKNLLGPVQTVAAVFGTVLDLVTRFVDTYPRLSKWIVLGGALASTLLVIGGAVTMAAGAMLVGLSYVPAGLTVLAAGFSLVGSAATFAWAAITGPIGLTIAALAAVGFAVYEVYKHWDSIRAFFAGLAHTIYTAGAQIVSSLVAGMMSKVAAVETAISAIAGKIRAYLPFSPAREGPLRTLSQMRISETIAHSIQAGPSIAAIRRTAAAIAIAAPMMAAPPVFAGVAGASSPPAIASRGGTVLNYSLTVNMPAGTSAKELMEVLRQHKRELKEILDSQASHEARRGF